MKRKGEKRQEPRGFDYKANNYKELKETKGPGEDEITKKGRPVISISY